jgi:hypothetical protein
MYYNYRGPRRFLNSYFVGVKTVAGIECEYWISDIDGYHYLAPINWEFTVASAKSWSELISIVEEYNGYKSERRPDIYCRCDGQSVFTGFNTLTIEVCKNCGLEKPRWIKSK